MDGWRTGWVERWIDGKYGVERNDGKLESGRMSEWMNE